MSFSTSYTDALAEVEGLLEATHLLRRSPANARRLLRAVQRALESEGEAQSIEEVRAGSGATAEYRPRGTGRRERRGQARGDPRL